MGELFGSILSLAFVAQVLRITLPYVFTALGGVTSERSGVVDLSLEGKLLLSAFAAAFAADATSSAAAGAVAGVVGGAVVGALYGAITVRLRTNQIVAGVAFNILAMGLTRYLLKLCYGSTSNSPPTPGFEGGLLTNALFWMGLALVALWQLGFWRTRFGLRLRAVGEHPAAASSLGVDVSRVRYAAVLLSGALAGLGGAWLALDNQGFTAEMSGGRGYIALAAVIMGGWRPLQAALACLLFGFAEALQLNLQASSLGVPGELLRMLPYALTMVVLAGAIGRSRAPAALGRDQD